MNSEWFWKNVLIKICQKHRQFTLNFIDWSFVFHLEQAVLLIIGSSRTVNSPQGSCQKFSAPITLPPLFHYSCSQNSLPPTLLKFSILWSYFIFSIPSCFPDCFHKFAHAFVIFCGFRRGFLLFWSNPSRLLCSLIQKPFYPLLFWARNYARR